MSDDPSDEIETFLLMPVNHISNYAQFVDGLLNEYKTRTLLGSEFKTIAGVEIEIKKLHKLVTENYALNSMKASIVSTPIFFFFFEKLQHSNQIIFYHIFSVLCPKIRRYHLFR